MAPDRPEGREQRCRGGPGRFRDCDLPLFRRALCQLSYRSKKGDRPDSNRPLVGSQPTLPARGSSITMAVPTGLEPATSGLTSRRSTLLSYETMFPPDRLPALVPPCEGLADGPLGGLGGRAKTVLHHSRTEARGEDSNLHLRPNGGMRCGPARIRTGNLLLARELLCRWSYGPMVAERKSPCCCTGRQSSPDSTMFGAGAGCDPLLPRAINPGLRHDSVFNVRAAGVFPLGRSGPFPCPSGTRTHISCLGTPGGTRTHIPRIRSPVLLQLSFRGMSHCVPEVGFEPTTPRFGGGRSSAELPR